jgi:hypothetical protein
MWHVHAAEEDEFARPIRVDQTMTSPDATRASALRE